MLGLKCSLGYAWTRAKGERESWENSNSFKQCFTWVKDKAFELIFWFLSLYTFMHSTNLLNASIAKDRRVKQRVHFSGLRKCMLCILDICCSAYLNLLFSPNNPMVFGKISPNPSLLLITDVVRTEPFSEMSTWPKPNWWENTPNIHTHIGNINCFRRGM